VPLTGSLAAFVAVPDPWRVPPPSFVTSQFGGAEVSRAVMRSVDGWPPVEDSG
jgi:hypothetical protein